MDEVDDVDLEVQRVAALDLGKAALEACVRVPHPRRPDSRMQEVRGYATTTAELLEKVGWLRHWHLRRVVMESTSTYWKGVYYLLEAEGLECWLVNAREVKNVPGRAKTDRADAVWLAKVAERGMCRPSLVHPPEIRRLRDLTRYRVPWCKTARANSNGSKSCSRTPRSRSRRCCRICTAAPGVRSWTLSSLGSAIRIRWPGWLKAVHARRLGNSKKRCADSSPTTTRRSCK